MSQNDIFFETYTASQEKLIMADELCKSYLIANSELYVGDCYILDKYMLPITTTSNGNCLVNAVSIAICGKEKYSDDLRDLLTTELVENLHFYKKVCSEVESESEWDRLLEDAQNPGRELGAVHIFSLSNAIKRPIILLCSEECRSTFSEGEQSPTATFLPTRREPSECIKRPIILSWNSPHKNHYVPIVPVNNTSFVFKIPEVAYIKSLKSSLDQNDYINLEEPVIPCDEYVLKAFKKIKCRFILENLDGQKTHLERSIKPHQFHLADEIFVSLLLDDDIDAKSMTQDIKNKICYSINGYAYKYNCFILDNSLKKKLVAIIIKSNVKYESTYKCLNNIETKFLEENIEYLDYKNNKTHINSILEKMQSWNESDIFKTIDLMSQIILNEVIDDSEIKFQWICSLLSNNSDYFLTVASLRYFLNMFHTTQFQIFEPCFFPTVLKILQRLNGNVYKDKTVVLMRKFIPQLFENIVLMHKMNEIAQVTDSFKECFEEYTNIILNSSFDEFPEDVQKKIIVSYDQMCYYLDIGKIRKEIRMKLFELCFSDSKDIAIPSMICLQGYVKKNKSRSTLNNNGTW